MSILLLVMTDGRRECIERTLASARDHLHGPITRAVIHDDSGDEQYAVWLRKTFPGYGVFSTTRRSGFAGAIGSAWGHISDRGAEDFVFHLEDDFTFNRHVHLPQLAAVLDARPELAQLALRRQPWNDAEQAAGGVIEQHPEAYTEKVEPLGAWLEHRLFFTTNPSLYRRSLCSLGWPGGAESEGRFTHRVLEDRTARFGFWGHRSDEPWVTHIGKERVGVGY